MDQLIYEDGPIIKVHGGIEQAFIIEKYIMHTTETECLFVFLHNLH